MLNAQPSPPDENFPELADFAQVDDDAGVSLEALSTAYAELIAGGSIPYEMQPAEDSAAPATTEDVEEPDDPELADQHCEVTPASIFEAMLFVGHPNNDPITSGEIASMMRGVRSQEIDELVQDLNQQYELAGCPYRIASSGAGYALQLAAEYARLRDKFYGRVREARLSQTAVDILAIVAYRQPLTRDEIDQLRGKSSSSVLSQLVRRQLLRIERLDEKPRKVRYFTTDRFLQLFGLDNLTELPQTNEVDKTF